MPDMAGLSARLVPRINMYIHKHIDTFIYISICLYPVLEYSCRCTVTVNSIQHAAVGNFHDTVPIDAYVKRICNDVMPQGEPEVSSGLFYFFLNIHNTYVLFFSSYPSVSLGSEGRKKTDR